MDPRSDKDTGWPYATNNGFWDRDPGERARMMDAACERHGMSNFFDLDPEDRAKVYDADESY